MSTRLWNAKAASLSDTTSAPLKNMMSTSQKHTMSTPLEMAERRMRQRWYDLEMAESQGQSAETLAARYEQYLRALRVYLDAFERDAERLAS